MSSVPSPQRRDGYRQVSSVICLFVLTTAAVLYLAFLDQIVGNAVEVDSQAMLAQLHATGRTIRFYRSFPAAHAVKRGGTVDVSTSPKRWWDAASSPINRTQRIERGFICVRDKVLKGVVGVGIRGDDVLNILGSEAMWGVYDGVNELYISIASFGSSDQVAIRNRREWRIGSLDRGHGCSDRK